MWAATVNLWESLYLGIPQCWCVLVYTFDYDLHQDVMMDVSSLEKDWYIPSPFFAPIRIFVWCISLRQQMKHEFISLIDSFCLTVLAGKHENLLWKIVKNANLTQPNPFSLIAPLCWFQERTPEKMAIESHSITYTSYHMHHNIPDYTIRCNLLFRHKSMI